MRQKRRTTYIAATSHSLHSARGLRDEGILQKYVGPTFLPQMTASLPWGRLRARASSRIVRDIPRPYRPSILTESARALGAKDETLAMMRVRDSRNAIESATNLVMQSKLVDASLNSGAATWRSIDALQGKLIIERRELHPSQYQDWREVAPAGLKIRVEDSTTLEEELRRADALIVYSDTQRRSLSPYTDRPIHVVHLGVGPFVGRSRRDNVRQPVIGFLGRHDFLKGFDLFGAMSSHLRDKFAMTSAGHADDWAKELAGDDVRMHGHISPSDVPGFLAGLDYLVLPSRLESCGLVVMEAARMGVVPIVSSDVGCADLVARDLHELLVVRREDFVDGHAAELIIRIHQDRLISQQMLQDFCNVNSWPRHRVRYANAVATILDTEPN